MTDLALEDIANDCASRIMDRMEMCRGSAILKDDIVRDIRAALLDYNRALCPLRSPGRIDPPYDVDEVKRINADIDATIIAQLDSCNPVWATVKVDYYGGPAEPSRCAHGQNIFLCDDCMVAMMAGHAKEIRHLSPSGRQPLSQDAAEILSLLGYDEKGHGLRTEKDWGGTPVTMCHDPYYDLEGAVIDLERTGADKVCISTIKRIQARLAAVSKYAEERSS